MRNIKKFFIFVVIGIGVYLFVHHNQNITDLPRMSSTGNNQSVLNAVQKHLKGVSVGGVGRVSRVLSDDNHGDRHQRFILRLDSGHTVLIAHNIDVAPGIKLLKRGDVVQFYGEYEWNAKGGVIHWTHHDPRGYHIGGWLKHKGKIFR